MSTPSGPVKHARRHNPKFDVLAWRDRMGLTQQECCAVLDIEDRQWRRWEREGHSPPDHQVRAMVKLENEKRFGIAPVTRKVVGPPTVDKRKVRIPPSVRPKVEDVDILPSRW